MIVINLLSSLLVFVSAGPATVSYKDQYCTDPRTLQKHEAYTEWADAYSCTRHRCQPGGRNLAIYTVGCKRVEAPESAIECEEVVEDTNMQFPYCCTRLRCLVVVRGEVWTRVLGQPWETLPAAPWSHMYKMKKPPPTDGTFLTKTPSQDPIYELAETDSGFGRYKVLRPGKKTTTEATDCNDVAPRAAPAPAPDIVIALSTSDGNDHENRHNIRHTKRSRKPSPETDVEEDLPEQHSEPEIDEVPNTDKEQHERVSWTEIPQNQLNEHELSTDVYEPSDTNNYHQPDFPSHDTERKEDKPANLQALVDAIGTRMRDIENVVQKMSEKVHQVKLGEPDFENFERSSPSETEILEKHHKSEAKEHNKEGHGKAKKPNPDDDHYKRFLVRNRGSKYVRIATDDTTEQPIFIEDTNLSGYFSDSSNSVLRRSNSPKEPLATYMAPVENRRKASDHIASDDFIEAEKKHKKHVHKKKRSKGKCHKKRRGKEKKKKKINRVNSMELERNVVSLEDSSAVVSK